MKKRATIILLIMVILTGVLVKTVPGETETPTIYTTPQIYTALGDSITQAANACNPWEECPEKSWATGNYKTFINQTVTIKEHLEALSGKPVTTYNNARSYTKVNDLPNQAQTAVAQKAEFVTILSGANDVCAPTEEEITSDEQFRKSVQETLNIFQTQLPKTKILIVSIPNIYTLWETNHTNETAIRKWVSANLCGSMLANPTSLAVEDEERRQRVLKRIEGFNTILEEECSKNQNCLFDAETVFKTVFTEEELSPVDYFHPSQKGQQLLANKVWTSELSRFTKIVKGKSVRSSDTAPIINIVQPQNEETIHGDDFKLIVQVDHVNPLKKVYVDTQLGGFSLSWDPVDKNWYLKVDTTLAPDLLKTSFTVVAVDRENETAISEKITVKVDNRNFLPSTSTPSPTSSVDIIENNTPDAP